MPDSCSACEAATGRLGRASETEPYRPYREVLRAVLTEIGTALGFEPSPDELFGFSASVRNWPPFPDSSEALRANDWAMRKSPGLLQCTTDRSDPR